MGLNPLIEVSASNCIYMFIVFNLLLLYFQKLNWPLQATKGQILGGSLLKIDLHNAYLAY